jgi:phosphatidylserine/phosphatidylglycerophosphate/cardiolipin synthase-like enzyme
MVNFTGDKLEVSGASENPNKVRIAKNFEVLSPQDFLEDFEHEAAEAKERVLGQSLTFEAKSSGEVVTRIFAQTAPKHVRKELLLDWYTRLETDQQLTSLSFLNPFTRKKLLDEFKAKEELWEQILRVGVDLTFTNPPRNFLERLFPVTGRNHMKAAGVDGRVFYIGGFNYGNFELELADFMVKFTDPEIVGFLIKQWERANSRRVINDYEVHLDSDFELIVDGGRHGSSIIMSRAVLEVKKSRRFVLAITANLFPNGEFSQELEEASNRGVKVESVCGSAKVVHRWPISNHHLFWLVAKWSILIFKLRKYSFPVIVSRKKGVHAKLLLVDGRVAMIGSHNLNDNGVLAGTKEWMVLSRNKTLISNLMKFYEELRGEITNGYVES